MCDAIYLSVAMVGLLAVGSVIRLLADAGRSPNADLVAALLAEEGEPLPEDSGPQASLPGSEAAASV